MGKVIAISTNKGGSGKTSLVTNIAGVIGLKKKVLIIDTDGQGNTSLAFGINPNKLDPTIYDVLMGEAKPEEAIINVGHNVDILPANGDMDFFDIEVLTDLKKSAGNPFFLMKKALGSLSDKYDYIFIDTPPALGLVVGSVLVYADEVIVPFIPTLYDVKGLVRLLGTIEDFKQKYNPNLSVRGVVGTMVESRTTLHTEMLEEAYKYCSSKGIKLYDNVIPRSIKFSAATAYDGKPAVWAEANNPLVRSYFKLTREITKGDN